MLIINLSFKRLIINFIIAKKKKKASPSFQCEISMCHKLSFNFSVFQTFQMTLNKQKKNERVSKQQLYSQRDKPSNAKDALRLQEPLREKFQLFRYMVEATIINFEKKITNINIAHQFCILYDASYVRSLFRLSIFVPRESHVIFSHRQALYLYVRHHQTSLQDGQSNRCPVKLF